MTRVTVDKSVGSGTDPAEVTVVVVPRERASVAFDSLRSIYEHTSHAFDLVYVDCLLPFPLRRKVRALVREHGDTYVRSEDYLYPNQARNVGIEQASSEYLVFVDNDVFVEPGWLEALVDCAGEPGAGVVGPLYLEGDRQNQVVHCAGGEIITESSADGGTTLITRQYELGLPISELPELTRERTGLIEFHCVLLTRECLAAIGGAFDEELLTTREHVDLCLLARDAGYEVYLEPDSRVSYGKEEAITVYDLPYFMFRWSDGATRKTIERFENKWGVSLDPGRRDLIRRRRVSALRDVLERYGLDFVEPFYRKVRPAVPERLRPFGI